MQDVVSIMATVHLFVFIPFVVRKRVLQLMNLTDSHLPQVCLALVVHIICIIIMVLMPF